MPDLSSMLGSGMSGIGGGYPGIGPMDAQPLDRTKPSSFWDSFTNFMIGSPSSASSLQRFAPYQQQAMHHLLNLGLSGLQNPSAGFSPIAEQARAQFSQKTIPSILERFTSMGDNALSSGTLGTQLGSASSDLEKGLAALQSQYGMQQQTNLARLLGLGMQPQHENVISQGTSGLMQELARSLPMLATLFL